MPSGTFRRRLAATVIFLAAVGLGGRGGSDVMAQAQNPFPRRLDVPPLPKDLAWLNTAGPLSLEELRGKFVLLDFWTYCCINCMHILPELKKLEAGLSQGAGGHRRPFGQVREPRRTPRTSPRRSCATRSSTRWSTTRIARSGTPSAPIVADRRPDRSRGQCRLGARAARSRSSRSTTCSTRRMPYYRRQGTARRDAARVRPRGGRTCRATPLRFPGKVLADEAGRTAVHRRQQSQPHRRRPARRHAGRHDRLGRDRPGRRRLSPPPSSTSRRAWPSTARRSTWPTPRTT